MSAHLMTQFPDELSVMQRALHLARLGEGFVEPNPCVGAVIVDETRRLLGEGYHERFGGPHAEVMALRQAGESARGATLFVTLEPCSHFGKTPPCADAVIAAGIRRVVISVGDPAKHNSGAGVEKLRAAGIEVEVGLCSEEGSALLAPFVMLMTEDRPFVHAKWAMTLDGKIATRTGASRWITNARSRETVHQLRGQMDAILIGSGTALADDPLLTARPAGPRRPLRVVLDSQARLPLQSRLLSSLEEGPVLIAVAQSAPSDQVNTLLAAGAEVWQSPVDGDPRRISLAGLLKELALRKVTNLFVEGGGQVLGAFLDSRVIDEVHCFIAPTLIGGEEAPGPMGGLGFSQMNELPRLHAPEIRELDGDVYIRGRVSRA